MRYLHRIKMPTLIVWGDEDKIIPVQHTDTWRKLVPHADIKIYKGAGHLVHLEKPEAVDAIATFLRCSFSPLSFRPSGPGLWPGAARAGIQ